MRKLLFTVLLAVMCCQLHAQEKSFIRNGDVFQTIGKSSTSSATKTRFTWKDSKGQSYPVFVSTKTGSCFVKKVSKKSGKEYPKYLGDEISREICKELKINYTPKQKK